MFSFISDNIKLSFSYFFAINNIWLFEYVLLLLTLACLFWISPSTNCLVRGDCAFQSTLLIWKSKMNRSCYSLCLILFVFVLYYTSQTCFDYSPSSWSPMPAFSISIFNYIHFSLCKHMISIISDQQRKQIIHFVLIIQDYLLGRKQQSKFKAYPCFILKKTWQR